MTTDSLVEVRDGSASLWIDARYFPITIYTWQRSSLRLAHEYSLARRHFDARARREERKIILVSDLTEFGMPTASVRKAIADDAAEIDRSDAMHGYVCVVPNALIRGVITAMVWIIGGQTRPNTNVADLPGALRVALTECDRVGQPRPELDPDSYALSTSEFVRTA